MKTLNLYILLPFLLLLAHRAPSQETELPFAEVPAYSENYTAGTMAARMVEALGFRFYWATDGLTSKDLTYAPSEDARTTEATIKHILDLSYIIVNSTLKQENVKQDTDAMDYDDMRSQTLLNLKMAADILRSSDDISQYKILFGEREIPFWNQVNGPIADAIWHCGQIASFRRSTGNSINPKVNHFMGNVKKD